jgi:hypothetical protein
MKIHDESLEPNLKFDEEEYDLKSIVTMQDELDEDLF